MCTAQTMMSSSLLLMFTLLVFPLLTTLSPSPKHKSWAMTHVKTAVLLAFLVSLFPVALFCFNGLETIVSSYQWTSTGGFFINISFKFDHYSVIFIPVGLFVTWSILEFASWYMHSDPNMNRFFKCLLIFLIAMLILVTANNLFQLFIGWEGVGIMSFVLISWWFARADANTAALQAVAYNRVGDIGLIYAMAWTSSNLGTWDLDQMIYLAKEKDLTAPLIALIIAATGKSAQFGLHPWLPAAMEGPTPVSALLHSSTMVVAGIFLLVRTSPMMADNQVALTTCLCLGAITTFFAAICAVAQNDVKKVIAFSTSSQLGLMMVTIGLGQPQLAFLHICTHAFFKAMLFMCSGSLIHSLNDEQDVRKMGGMHNLVPFTSASMLLGSLALTGTPFLSGFFSKDAIIESMNSSHLNAWALGLVLAGTALTAVYSLRLVFFIMLGNTRAPALSPLNENDKALLHPIKRLGWGSILAGFLISLSFIPMKVPFMTLPLLGKVMALFMTAIGLILSYDPLKIAAKHLKPLPTKLPPSRFTSLQGYFPFVIHRLTPKSFLNLGQKICNMMVDQSWLEKLAPKAAATTNIPLATATTDAQLGAIKTYLGLSFLTFILATMLVFL